MIIDNNASSGDRSFPKCHDAGAVEFEAALANEARGLASGYDISCDRSRTHRRRYTHHVQSGMQMHTYILAWYCFYCLCASTLELSRTGLVLNAAEVQLSGQTETSSNHLRIANNVVDNATISDSASQFSSNALNTGNNNNDDAGTSTALQSGIRTDPTASGIKPTDILEVCDFVGFIGPALNEMNAESDLNVPSHPESNVVTFSRGC